MQLKPGKLPHGLLARMLEQSPIDDHRVVVGPRVGEDAAAIDFGDRLLVVKTDPITFAADLIGWYAVHVNANDIASMGAEPRWFLAALLMPRQAQEEDVARVFDQICQACKSLGVTLVGGHTEVTMRVDQPVVVGCMLGEVTRDKLVTSSGARPGDVVILSGEIATEGTALLAREAAEALLAEGWSQSELTQARDLLLDPGISVVSSARLAVRQGGVTALHDPTEGGLVTGLREVAIASGVGLEIDLDAVPVHPVTRAICAALSLHPLGLIASGSLLITASREEAEGIVSALDEAGHPVTVIGRVLPGAEGLWIVEEGRRQPLPEFARDELARFFEEREREHG